jgi:hypothetical protein
MPGASGFGGFLSVLPFVSAASASNMVHCPGRSRSHAVWGVPG